jgi:hypothetical protein
MSLFAGRSPQAARLPERLDDLHGPWRGVVVLPVHLTWHGLREFDVALEKPRLLLYSIVLSQGRPNDLARFVNPRRLYDDWPQLRRPHTPGVRAQAGPPSARPAPDLARTMPTDMPGC